VGLRKVAIKSIQLWQQDHAAILQRQHHVLVLSRSEKFDPWRDVVYEWLAFAKTSFFEREEDQGRTPQQRMRRLPEAAVLISDENLFGVCSLERKNVSVTTLYDWAADFCRESMPFEENV
jgi:hypothetical protein